MHHNSMMDCWLLFPFLLAILISNRYHFSFAQWQLLMVVFLLMYLHGCNCWEFLIYATGSWAIILFLGHCWGWCCPPSRVYAPASWASSTSQSEHRWQCLHCHGDYISTWGNLHTSFHFTILLSEYFFLFWRALSRINHVCVAVTFWLFWGFWLLDIFLLCIVVISS